MNNKQHAPSRKVQSFGMKLLFTRFPLESAHGGAEVQTLSLMEGLLARGHAVAFLGSCPVILAECLQRGIPAAKLDIGPPPVTKWSAVSFLWRRRRMQRLLAAAIKEFHNLDAVLMLSLSEKILLTPLLLKPQPNRTPRAVWIEHDRIGRWLTHSPWLPQIRKLHDRVTTIVVSELSRSLYIALGWPRDNVIAIPNGVAPPDRAARPIREETEETVFSIGCIARLSHDKGVDLLIEVVKDIPAVRLSIIGKGTEERRLRTLAAPVRNRVTIQPWTEDLGAFYASLDLFVLPSRVHDPFGLVAAEAMFCGVPVIVTDTCGIAAHIEPGTHAVVVRANSAAALRQEILALSKQPERRKRLAKAGRAHAETHFTVERMIDHYERVLSACP